MSRHNDITRSRKGQAYWSEGRLSVAVGNLKLGSDTLIWNPGGSATDCPSRACGSCQLEQPEQQCYALKAERHYPTVLPYRREQRQFFLSHSARRIADTLITILSRGKRGKRINRIRINESGDFATQEEIEKADEIMRIVAAWFKHEHNKKIKIHGYCARADFDYSRITTMVIKGSGHDNAHGRCQTIPTMDDLPEGYKLCKGNCRVCRLCMMPGVNVAIPLH